MGGQQNRKHRLTTCKKIRWAVCHCPTLLPSILKDVHLDSKLTKRILFNLLPRRTSIEIECMGSLCKGLNMSEEEIEKKYKVLSYKEDCDDTMWKIPHLDIKDYREHKISIKNYTQLQGLFLLLKDMKKHCILNTASGTHIHVDMKKTSKLTNFHKNKVESFFTAKCENGTIQKIFHQNKDIHSGMSEDPECKSESTVGTFGTKSKWIAYRNISFNSLEFRKGTMTFDYSTIIEWFIKLNKLIDEFEDTLTAKKIKYR
jgi:hypothetical protein